MEAERTKSGRTQKTQEHETSTVTGGSPMESFKQNTKGMIIIARNEIISYLKSTRMIVLMIIFVLTVLSGAYLFASIAASNIESRPPEYLVWTFIIDYDEETFAMDALIITTDIDGQPVGNVEISLYGLDSTFINKSQTDEFGRLIFYDIDPQNYINAEKGGYKENYRLLINSISQYNQFLSHLSLYAQAQAADLDEDNVKDDIAILILNDTFEPVENAVVTRDGKVFGESETNTFGLSRDYNLLKDKYDYITTWNNIETGYEVEVLSDDLDIENALQLKGPDDVLMQIAGFFISMIVPIIAIGIAFDSISREKLSKSVVFLLCRPIGKRSIAAGKFIGSITALAIPLTAISLIGVWIIASRTNEAPTTGFVAGFLLVTIVFMAIFVLLQQIFSTLAKTTGNAILAGIGIWLFFYIFWSLIVFAVSSALGYQFNSMEYYNIVYKMALFSPVSSYSLIIEAISPTGGQAPVGIPEWAAFVSFAVWTIVLFIIALELFRKKPYL